MTTSSEHETESSERETEASVSLPADLHAVVFFQGERGREHIDVRLRSDATQTELSGVQADESRGHPPLHRFELSADERAEYEARVRELSQMPRCEPLGRMPDEPTFRIESDAINDEGPSLWFRDDGAALLADEDHCLASVRLAHFVYQTWMAHPRR